MSAAPVSDAVAWLRRPEAIRERCGQLLAAAEARRSDHFRVVRDRLPALADYVSEEIRANYPSLEIPYHSRWRHFSAGGRDRWGRLKAGLQLPPDEVARLRIDLALTSVLLDAGAGPVWRYREAGGQALSRSEGLAVASFDLFTAGRLSDRPEQPLRADGAALKAFTAADLAAAFQVGDDNPLDGLEGRAGLINRLGAAIEAAPEVYGSPARVGHLYDYLAGECGAVPATAILAALLETLGPIWPGRIVLDGVNLGDVWRHPAAGGDGLVPFHKLSQWLTYSLVEPLVDAGLEVTGIEDLTGLAEYRNGGLMIDGSLLALKDPAALQARHPVDSELIVEWRALTLALLDPLAEAVRDRLGQSVAELPLAKVLEGGTWSARTPDRSGETPRRRPAAGHRERRNGLLSGSKACHHDGRELSEGNMSANVTVVDHPLVQHKLGLMRRKDTHTAAFRQLLREISLLLAYEVTRDLPLTSATVETPLTETTVPKLEGKKLALISVLRAGNGLLEGMLDLIPSARVGHVGSLPRPDHPGRRGVLLQGARGPGRAGRDRGRSHAGDRQFLLGRPRPGQAGRRQGSALCLPSGGAGRDRGDPGGPSRRADLHRRDRRPPERPRLHRARPGRRGRQALRDEVTASRRWRAIKSPPWAFGRSRRA